MIHVRSASQRMPLPRQLIQRTARAALSQQGAQGDLSIVLTDDEELREKNRDYLGIDAVTDVLSFPAEETDPQSGRNYLGDILIAVPRAAEQAHAAGHPLEAEVQLLVIHGVLHLLGHDHAEPEQKARMWAAQSAILKSLGLGDLQIRET